MILGSLVDCILTSPDEFKDRFFLSDSDAVGGMLGKYIMLVSCQPEEYRDIPVETREAIRRQVGFKQGLDYLNKEMMKEYAREYYDNMRQQFLHDIMPVSPSVHKQARDIADTLQSDPFTGKYFRETTSEYQKAVFFEYRGIKCKQLYDIWYQNPDDSYSILDVKTTERPVTTYHEAIMDFQLYVQAGFYLFPYYAGIINTKVRKEFKFIVADARGLESPRIYTLDMDQVHLIMRGGTLANGMRFRGIIPVMDDLIWHTETGKWEYSREYYESGSNNIKILTP
jgi:hypothetical protein